MLNTAESLDPATLLAWYVENGADEAVGDALTDHTALPEMPTPAVLTSKQPEKEEDTAPLGTHEAVGDAREIAAKAQTLEELRAALEKFEGLSIKRSATQLVFADGVSESRVMFIGEAPGADEDRLGKPFVGVSGRLLDTMLSHIGLSRAENFYITNILNWRPPGNRSPSDSEIAISLPFIRRHIELVNPAVVVFVGGVAAKALLETSQGITRLRGRWMDYTLPALEKPIPALATLHPAFLLRNPAQKAAAWQDILSLKAKLRDLHP